MNSAPRILILYAHPAPRNSRVNRRLCEVARTIPNVFVHDLYDTYPDFHIDVQHEQMLLASSDLIIFQYPVYWYSTPSLLKEWLDVVLEHGWAYGHGGDALQGKDSWLVASTGGQESSYSESGHHHRSFEDFLPPIEQTALFCGMRWLPPLILHGARTIEDSALEERVERFRQRLVSYPQWTEQFPAAPYAPAATDSQH